MVRITVCFKIVPDYEEIPALDWQRGELPDTAYCKKMYGCFDEAALEMGLRLKDALTEMGREVRITAATSGPRQATLLTGLYAAGFDRVVCIGESDSVSDPVRTARQLASYLREEPADLILTGRQAGGWDSGTVPAYLAAALSMPWIPEVIRLGPGETSAHTFAVSRGGEASAHTFAASCGGEASAHTCAVSRGAEADALTFAACCEGETEWQNVLIHAPAVLSVGNADVSYLRMFSIKARLEARKKETVSWPAEPVSGEAPYVAYLSRIKETSCDMLEGTANDQAGALQKLVREGRDG